MTVRSGLRNGITRRWQQGKARVREGTPLWLWLVGATLMLAIPYFFPAEILGLSVQLADRVRWSGMVFQLAGLATVIIGLNRSRRDLKGSSLWKAVGQWMKGWSYVVVPPKPIRASGRLVAGLGTITARGRAIPPRVGKENLEQRVARLEIELQQLEQTHSEMRLEVRQLRGITRDAIDRERVERMNEVREIRRDLETAVIGGIQLEVAGVCYLVFGIVMTATPQEIAWILVSVGL